MCEERKCIHFAVYIYIVQRVYVDVSFKIPDSVYSENVGCTKLPSMLQVQMALDIKAFILYTA